jgi:hypothetical protein
MITSEFDLWVTSRPVAVVTKAQRNAVGIDFYWRHTWVFFDFMTVGGVAREFYGRASASCYLKCFQ